MRNKWILLPPRESRREFWKSLGAPPLVIFKIPGGIPSGAIISIVTKSSDKQWYIIWRIMFKTESNQTPSLVILWFYNHNNLVDCCIFVYICTYIRFRFVKWMSYFTKKNVSWIVLFREKIHDIQMLSTVNIYMSICLIFCLI